VSVPAPAPLRGAGILPASGTQTVAAYPSAPAPPPMLSDAGVETGAPSAPVTGAGLAGRMPAPHVAGTRAQSGPPAGGPGAPPSGGRPPGDLPQLWASLLEAVGRASPFTRTYLLEAHPVSLDKNVLTVGFDPEFEGQIGLADTARTHSLLQTKLGELGCPNVQFKFIRAEAPARPAPPSLEPQPAPNTRAAPPAAAAAPAKDKSASQPAGQEDFKNDPLIRKALEIFKGQIVEIRA